MHEQKDYKFVSKMDYGEGKGEVAHLSPLNPV
jgi:hypothetical protein